MVQWLGLILATIALIKDDEHRSWQRQQRQKEFDNE